MSARAWADLSDVRDMLIVQYIDQSAMDEGNNAVDRCLADIGVDTSLVPESTPDVLRDMAVAYACYRAALYAMAADDDAYSVKMKQYRDEYDYRRRSLTSQQAIGSTVAASYGSIRVERG